ncbi:hypothetical protein SteCoe_5804 [Stentor coeruleus]|uniref:Rab-GAP TBC domain-containing protein n=1 Tax=Stentor coeruleus TaxID=5963 RepID=A0A1R2CRM6_9CILI|nr:hypothetical protein SteCoe_5804 [Stentor coeruleus]
MSFKDMPHSLNEIFSHLNDGSSELKSLSLFFKGVKNAFDTFSIDLNKNSDSFKLLKPESTLTQSMHSLKRYFKQIVTYQLSFINSLQTDIIEPLDLFYEHFTGNNIEIKTNSENTSKPLRAAHLELQKVKTNYYQQSETLEKLKRTIITSNNQQTIAAQQKQYEISVNIAQENYKKRIDEVNYLMAIYESEMPSLLESLQQNEESRIYFIKSTAEKHIRHYQKMIESLNTCLIEFSDSVTFINSNFDIKNFIGRLENPMEIQKEFVDYMSWKNMKKIDEVSDLEIVNSVIDFIILNKSCKFADFPKLNEILLSNKGKDMFIRGLECLKHNEKIENEGFNKLADILKRILSSLEDDETSQMHFCKIIALSHVFFIESNGQKRYLTELLKSEKIWDNEKRWISAIQLAISAKLLVDKESLQKVSHGRKKPSFILSTLKDLALKIPLPNKEKPIEKSDKSSAYNILSHFTYQMSNLSVPSKIAQSIVMKIADNYMLEADRICTLLSQIQVERETSPQKKRISRVFNQKILRLVLEYLNPIETLNLLTLNKTFKTYLQPYVYYDFLYTKRGNAEKIRKKHWENQLKLHFPPTDYNALLDKISKNIEFIGEMNDIIDMDVNRSYQDRTEMHQALKNVLKTYAFFNPDVSYCQGMNFIAGTFLQIFKDESFSFKCLIGLVKKFDMSPIFQVGVPKLRCMLYQLDQIIEIKLPDIQKVFKLEGVSAGFFSSSWFLTLFSSNLQSKIPVLLQIWDYFFIKGWKVIFKASVAILKLMGPKIRGGTFDEIMSLITGANLYTEEFFNEGFIVYVKEVKITNSLLARLEEDYNKILALSNRSPFRDSA